MKVAKDKLLVTMRWRPAAWGFGNHKGRKGHDGHQASEEDSIGFFFRRLSFASLLSFVVNEGPGKRVNTTIAAS